MYLIDKYVDPYAGTEKQMQYLVRGLNRSSMEPALTIFQTSPYINEHGFPCNVTTLHIRKLFSFFTVLKIVKFGIKIKKDGYQVVHIFFNDPSIISPIFLKLCGLKVIISRRDMGFWYTNINQMILRINRYFINGVVANCNAVKRVTHEKEYIPLEKIHVIYNGYDFNEIYQSNDKVVDNDLSFPEGTSVVGIVANIRPVKRIDDLIKAFALVNHKISNVILLIVGSGDISGYTRLVKDLGIDHKIQFMGKQKKVIDIIKKFNVAVLCSQTEGFSNSLLEYILCHVPVVCTDTGGNCELIKDGETGYLVPVGDINLLAERIYMLLSNHKKAKLFADQAAHHVTKLCGLDTMLSKHEKLYLTL